MTEGGMDPLVAALVGLGFAALATWLGGRIGEWLGDRLNLRDAASGAPDYEGHLQRMVIERFGEWRPVPRRPCWCPMVDEEMHYCGKGLPSTSTWDRRAVERMLDTIDTENGRGVKQ